MNRRFALVFAVLSLRIGAACAEPSNIVVTIDRANDKPVWLLNSKPMRAPLLTLSELKKDGTPDVPVLLLVHPKTTIDELSNALGTMSKAQTAKPRVFVFSEDKSVMYELSVGCPMLFSTDLSAVVPAHGGLGCSE